MLTQGVVLGQKQTDPTVPPPGHNLVIEGTLLQQWRVEGDPEFRDFPPGYQQRVFTFTNTIHPDGWSMRFDDSMVEGSRISWVMKSGIHYSLDDFSSMAPDDGLNQAEAVIRKTDVPRGDIFNSPVLIWAIYGSGREVWRPYQAEGKVPLLIHGTSPALANHGWKPPGRVELGADNSLGLIRYEAKSDGYNRRWQDELHCALVPPDVVERWREPFDKGFTISTFSVDRFTNAFGLRIPLSATFADYDPPNQGTNLFEYARATLNLKRVFLETATAVKEPEIKFLTMIHDRRFTQPESSQSIYTVSYMTNRWLSLEEAQKTSGYQSSKNFAQAARRTLNLEGTMEKEHLWGRKMVLFSFVLTSISVVVILIKKVIMLKNKWFKIVFLQLMVVTALGELPNFVLKKNLCQPRALPAKPGIRIGCECAGADEGYCEKFETEEIAYYKISNNDCDGVTKTGEFKGRITMYTAPCLKLPLCGCPDPSSTRWKFNKILTENQGMTVGFCNPDPRFPCYPTVVN